jgi:two-component system, response regulator
MTAEAGTILLVEDNTDDEALTIRALKRSGIANTIDVARDGEQALDYLLDHARALPQLVLLDLKLPKIDGLEVLRRVRQDERGKLVPIVILTSSKEDSDLFAGYTNGASSYVRKPVDFDKFAESVRQLGLYWLVINETLTLGGRAPA